VTQVKRFSLAMLLIASALVATAAPAFAQVGVPSDLDQRWLLGMVIVALTLIIAFLMAWYLPMGSKGDGPRRWVSRFSRKTRRRHRRKKYNP
jgi:Na+/melibiose symporter-like transporter